MRLLNMNLSFRSFMAAVDFIQIIIERFFEFKLLVEYYRCKDQYWLWLTALSMLLPGAVGTVLWTVQALKKRAREKLSLTYIIGVAAGLIVWPISSVIWYAAQHVRLYINPSVL